jgi:hypothetical protein
MKKGMTRRGFLKGAAATAAAAGVRSHSRKRPRLPEAPFPARVAEPDLLVQGPLEGSARRG